MKPLHVALIVKNSPASYAREDKNAGYFSYPVPEFQWDYFSPGKGEIVNTAAFASVGFDLILHIDGGNWCEYQSHAIPILYYDIDSTLSDDMHFRPRYEQARKADLVLVDHDRLERFLTIKRPVRRWSYCVNDHLYRPAVKTLDVCFHCGGHSNRAGLRVALSEMCAANHLSYVSGAVPLDIYAANMNRAKIVVNIPRTPSNRPHRVFDALAAGAALITAPLPDVSGEARTSGLHYLEAAPADLPDLARRLAGGNWQIPAAAGYEWSKAQTWAVRAQELRQMLNEELGL